MFIILDIPEVAHTATGQCSFPITTVHEYENNHDKCKVHRKG